FWLHNLQGSSSFCPNSLQIICHVSTSISLRRNCLSDYSEPTSLSIAAGAHKSRGVSPAGTGCAYLPTNCSIQA
ncbi:MAG: hypothetical protein WC299_02155, partial [Kiritimatiellia bacterium]